MMAIKKLTTCWKWILHIFKHRSILEKGKFYKEREYRINDNLLTNERKVVIKNYSLFSGNKDTGIGIGFSVTDLRLLSKHTGIGYWNLVKIFTRQKRKYWESNTGLVIICTDIKYKNKLKGKQGLNAIKAIRRK